jgi:phage/plasmid primase-like uncharacterized protein
MTTFVDFCRCHGVLIDQSPRLGVWLRYRTADKPAHRNGAVKYMGDHGFVQNHATMQEVALWRSEGESLVAAQKAQEIANQAAKDTLRRQQQAAQKAAQMLAECELKPHPYLASKGFPEERVNVLGDLMLLPMRVGRDVVGLQQIDPAGEKKYLFGQRSSYAQYQFTAGNGPHILCEGFATALSLRLALVRLRRPFTLHVCFSAGNMKKVARSFESGFVAADNDKSQTGQKVANEIGWPCWMSDQEGEDANDYHLRKGIFALSQGLQKMFLEARRM